MRGLALVVALALSPAAAQEVVRPLAVPVAAPGAAGVVGAAAPVSAPLSLGSGLAGRSPAVPALAGAIGAAGLGGLLAPRLEPVASLRLSDAPAASPAPAGQPAAAMPAEALKLAVLAERAQAAGVPLAAKPSQAGRGSYVLKRAGKPLITVTPAVAAAAREVLANVTPEQLRRWPVEALEALVRQLFDGLKAHGAAGDLVAAPGGAAPAAYPSLSRLRSAVSPERPAPPPAPKPRKKFVKKADWPKFLRWAVRSREQGATAIGLALGSAFAAWETLPGGWPLTLALAAFGVAAAWFAARLFADAAHLRKKLRGNPNEGLAKRMLKQHAHPAVLTMLALLGWPALAAAATELGLFAGYFLVQGDRLRFLAPAIVLGGAALAGVLYEVSRRLERKALAAETGVSRSGSLRLWLAALAGAMALAGGAAVASGPAPLHGSQLVRPSGADEVDVASLHDPARPAGGRLEVSGRPAAPGARAASDPAVAAAVSRGVAYLQASQRENGAWDVGPQALSPGWNGLHENVGITALAVDALEEAAGPAASKAEEAGDRFILEHVLADRGALLLERRAMASNNQYPYAASFGLRRLLRGYERSSGAQRAEYARAIDRVLGWLAFADMRYISGRDARGTFQLAVVAEALADARRLGLRIPAQRTLDRGTPAAPKDALDAIVALLESSRQADGTYPYRVGAHEPPAENYPRTALVEHALYAAGRSDKARLSTGVDHFIRSLPDLQKVLAEKDLLTHDYSIHGYAKYYFMLDLHGAAQALAELDSPDVKPRAVVLRDALLKLQADDGSWTDSPEGAGPGYGTAMAVRTLLILDQLIAR